MLFQTINRTQENIPPAYTTVVLDNFNTATATLTGGYVEKMGHTFYGQGNSSITGGYLQNNANQLFYSNSPDFVMGTSKFTYEVIFKTTITSGNSPILMTSDTVVSGTGLMMSIYQTDLLFLDTKNQFYGYITPPYSIVDNADHHLVLQYTGSQLQAFLDGNKIWEINIVLQSYNTQNLGIFGYPAELAGNVKKISAVRVTKGAALYPSSFGIVTSFLGG